MKRTLVALVTMTTLAAGCASTRPPNQLVDARVAYQQAMMNPAAPLVTADLYEARRALDAAERAYQDGDIEKAKNLAYIAHRRSIAVQAKAETARAVESKRVALVELQQFREAQAVATQKELERAKGALTIAQQEAEAQRQAREAAEEKVIRIEGVQAERSDKGLVLTISGSVLFASGKSELLPSAKERLKEVAKALEDDRRSLLVVGHTDAQGSDEANEKLSEERANSVRAYLVSEGIADDRVRSEGMGESQPIADNATPEGRANNRRVEIILEASPGSGHTEMPKREGDAKKGKERSQPPAARHEDKKAAPKKQP